ncbi:flap endonuclease Xni [Alkalimonas amylolytica]|uniref:Protein Xni n=1 Tax=Alkalimonas amylolytica TaxID=152573 RepID=A0A1H4FAJ8_ALKAM|nr:flap endonuclease Xni [Alkalimonas amylolytica]SEA94319.1 protein Xni [Alkalimonas amylolytica]
MTHLVLIDAMNLIRRLYAAQERPYLPLSDQLTESTRQQLMKNTTQAVEKALRTIIEQCQPSHLLLVFDSQQATWRHQLYPDYKANRSPMPAILQQALPELQQHILQLGIAIYKQEGYEADDIIASLALKMRQHQQAVTVVSTDKGYCPLLDSGVKLYDHFRREYLDEAYVQQKFGVPSRRLIRYWSLVGDSTNHIPGVAGIGPKTALELLQLGDTFTEILQHPDCPKAMRVKLTDHKTDIQCFLQLFQPRTDLELGLNLQQLRYPNQEPTHA